MRPTFLFLSFDGELFARFHQVSLTSFFFQLLCSPSRLEIRAFSEPLSISRAHGQLSLPCAEPQGSKSEREKEKK